jgi:hypothetical protein
MIDHTYTTCLVHTLSSRNLPMLKGAYKSYVEVKNKIFQNCLLHNANIMFIEHTYRSRIIPEGIAEASQIFLRDTHVLQKLVSYEVHCKRDRW